MQEQLVGKIQWLAAEVGKDGYVISQDKRETLLCCHGPGSHRAAAVVGLRDSADS